jgi:alpha-L-fucosidase
VEVAGIEPDTPCTETPVSIKDSEFSPEVLIKILTEISGTDRQMLTRIGQRWGSLSDDLKRAVLRVAG